LLTSIVWTATGKVSTGQAPPLAVPPLVDGPPAALTLPEPALALDPPLLLAGGSELSPVVPLQANNGTNIAQAKWSLFMRTFLEK
jgi:hypothetical protein